MVSGPSCAFILQGSKSHQKLAHGVNGTATPRSINNTSDLYTVGQHGFVFTDLGEQLAQRMGGWEAGAQFLFGNISWLIVSYLFFCPAG